MYNTYTLKTDRQQSSRQSTAGNHNGKTDEREIKNKKNKKVLTRGRTDRFCTTNSTRAMFTFKFKYKFNMTFVGRRSTQRPEAPYKSR